MIRLGFLRYYRILVGLEEGRRNSRNIDGHGHRIFAFMELTPATIAAAMATFADVVTASVLRAVDANVDGRLRADGTVKHNASST
jgi:hypothetical protein